MVKVETYTMIGKYYFVIRDAKGKMLHSSDFYTTRKKAKSEGAKYKANIATPHKRTGRGWRRGIKGTIVSTSAPRDSARRKVITKKGGKYLSWYWGKKVGSHRTKQYAIKRLRRK